MKELTHSFSSMDDGCRDGGGSETMVMEATMLGIGSLILGGRILHALSLSINRTSGYLSIHLKYVHKIRVLKVLVC